MLAATKSALASVALALSVTLAHATPSLVIDVGTGEVLHQEQATQTWYPASLTKLMTTYVALKAARDGRISLDTPFVVSARAARMAPSKMGFRPGTEVTLDNALKMLMVKSPNDVAVTIAEGTSGSVEAFADEMNREAARLGMQESHFVNPNGLPDDRQVTSARDMAVLGRALFRDFPESAGIFNIGALQLGSRIIPTHNGLMGRYPGIDGMKTGFTCAAGFNVVASASRNGRHLITVIMGAPSARDRTAKAANLFDKAFYGSLSGSGNVATLGSQGGQPPNMRQEACRGRSKAGGFASEFEDFSVPLSSAFNKDGMLSERAFMFEAAGQPLASGSGQRSTGAQVAALGRPHFDPVAVYIGRAPGWTGTALAARTLTPATTKPVAGLKPPANASAFAPAKPGDDLTSAGPLAADPNALPLHLHADAPASKKTRNGKPAAVALTPLELGATAKPAVLPATAKAKVTTATKARVAVKPPGRPAAASKPVAPAAQVPEQ